MTSFLPPRCRLPAPESGAETSVTFTKFSCSHCHPQTQLLPNPKPSHSPTPNPAVPIADPMLPIQMLSPPSTRARPPQRTPTAPLQLSPSPSRGRPTRCPNPAVLGSLRSRGAPNPSLPPAPSCPQSPGCPCARVPQSPPVPPSPSCGAGDIFNLPSSSRPLHFCAKPVTFATSFL